jgi:hypothetical protein
MLWKFAHDGRLAAEIRLNMEVRMKYTYITWIEFALSAGPDFIGLHMDARCKKDNEILCFLNSRTHNVSTNHNTVSATRVIPSAVSPPGMVDFGPAPMDVLRRALRLRFVRMSNNSKAFH